MGWIRQLDTTVVEANSTTGVLTLANAVPVGHTIIASVVWSNDSASIPTISSVADTRSNTWETASSAGASNATCSAAIFRSTLTTAMQSGDTITVTIGTGRIRWALEANEFDDVLTGAVDKVAANDNPANNTALTSGTTAATTQPYELVVGAFGFGRGGGATASVDAGWSGNTYVTTAAGSTDRALQTVWKYVTAAGAQQATCTLSASAGWCGCVAAFKGWVPAGAPAVNASAVRRAAAW